MKDAIVIAVNSWKDVQGGVGNTIYNCFRHCDIRSERHAREAELINDCIDQAAVNKLRKNVELITQKAAYTSPMSIDFLIDHPEKPAVNEDEAIGDNEEGYEEDEDFNDECKARQDEYTVEEDEASDDDDDDDDDDDSEEI
ncbi:hypothetical protein EDD11_008841 [Mortierella claussenii]|nr:hypothetical protein EDD11_008841 [Mortierella claussenii]